MPDDNAHIGEISIAQHWYNQAIAINKKSPDCIYRFMSSWLAFNFLYSERDRIDQRGNFKPERTIIKEYCQKHYTSLERAHVFEVCKKEVYKLLEEPVISMREQPPKSNQGEHTSCDWAKENRVDALNVKLPMKKRIVALVQIIYTVRCNLFHGAKSPASGRDYELVYSSTIIMEEFLKQLLP